MHSTTDLIICLPGPKSRRLKKDDTKRMRTLDMGQKVKDKLVADNDENITSDIKRGLRKESSTKRITPRYVLWDWKRRPESMVLNSQKTTDKDNY